MFEDIYLKAELNSIPDLIEGKGKRTKKKAMSIEPVSEEEKEFIEQYNVRLQKEQSKAKEDTIIYTKINMAYAVRNHLCYLPLVFHPRSITFRQYFQGEDYSNLDAVFKDIIVWETTQEKIFLSKEQLEAVIKHFRALENKAS